MPLLARTQVPIFALDCTEGTRSRCKPGCHCRALETLPLELQESFLGAAVLFVPLGMLPYSSFKDLETVGKESEFQAQSSAPGVRTSAGSGAARGCVGSVRASGENRGLPNYSALHMSHQIGWHQHERPRPCQGYRGMGCM